jgi:hypothetical protein
VGDRQIVSFSTRLLDQAEVIAQDERKIWVFPFVSLRNSADLLNSQFRRIDYEEYFDSLKEGEEAMSEAEYNECLASQSNPFNQSLN